MRLKIKRNHHHHHRRRRLPQVLPYSRGFLITGDYRVAGISTAAGTLAMEGVPADADLVGAFLFWETVHSG